MKKLVYVLLAIAIGISLYFRLTHRKPTIDMQQAVGKTNIVPVAIIGSGPAGLTAALYTARAHMPTVVITGNDVGGQLTEARYVENWPAMRKESGQNVMHELEKQVKHFGAHIVEQEVTEVDFDSWPYAIKLSNDQTIHALSVVVATGGKQKRLPIDGVDEFWGNGIGVCTICDAAVDKGKEVCIVGTSDYMCDMALQLKEFAKKVHVFVPKDRMEAAAVNVRYLEDAPNIDITYGVRIDQLVGKDGKLSEAIYTKDGKQETAPCESFYFAIGFKPQSELFKGQLELDKQGFIRIDSVTKETSKPLVYAAGNIVDKRYQKGLVAATMGAAAAIELIESLQNAGFTDAVEKELLPNYYHHEKPGDAVEKVEQGEDLDSYLTDDGYVMVEFYGENCPVCKYMTPIVQRCADEKRTIKWYKFDIQKDHYVIDNFDISMIPTFILFKDGKEVERITGQFSHNNFCEFFKKLES